MSNVLVLDRAELRAPSTAQLRLRRLSRALALLFAALMALSLLTVAAFAILGLFLDDHVSIGPDGAFLHFPAPAHATPGHVLLSQQPAATRLAGFANIVLATLPVFFVCFHLRSLFGLYAQGVVFARENAMHLKRIGAWLIAYPFVKFAANMIFRLAGGTDRTWFRGELVDALILGVIVFAIAQVMEFGREIEQDGAEII
jgi:hypothetical protein